ncbi:MAG: amidohydrolase, partial [Pseudomonadota bacterium]
LRYALEAMSSLGITSVHDMGVTARDIDIYKEFADRGDLIVRIYALLSGAGKELDAQKEPLIDYGNGRLTVRAVKLYADGALGSRGAAMLAPYSDDPHNKGLLFVSDDVMEYMIRKTNERGFQAAVHAIGDAANKQVLDAFDAVQDGTPSALRNRIEHAQVVQVEDIPRFATLGVIPSVQPTHATSDMNMAEDRVGADRIRGAYAWQRFLMQGSPIAAGSDFPVELANPFLGLHAAVTRQSPAGEPPCGWYPTQGLKIDQALRAFTLDAAYSAHQENQIGSLEIGKAADFIFVDQDIFEVDPAELYKTRVLATWVDGQPVYTRTDD